MLNGHGDDGYKHNQHIKADFSTNVWYGGAAEGLKNHIFANWDKVNKYPEVIGESLIDRIAVHYGFSDHQLLIANGTTESIYLIAQAFKGGKSKIVVPSFAEYEDACRLHDHEISFIDWENMLPDIKVDADLLFICNPNNPTGATMTWLPELIQSNPATVFVVDEAFIEFTIAIGSIIKLIKTYPNLIVLRSMTKAYAIPGLRLGYIASSPDLIRRLKAVKLPWTINTLALEAGHYIFDHYDEMSVPIDMLLNDKKEFVARLTATGVLKITDSDTHFFIAETTIKNGASLKHFLLNEYKLLIRDAANFRGLGSKFIRIATLDEVSNELLINALLQWK